MKISLILMLILISVSTVACPPESEFRQDIKKGLFNYLLNPEASQLTLYEVQDLISVYLGTNISEQNCSEITGDRSGLSIDIILSKSLNIKESVVPRCTDGTFYGECSKIKPKFCYSGMLRSMCNGPDRIYDTADDCGCPSEYNMCETDGTCSVQAINCYTDESC